GTNMIFGDDGYIDYVVNDADPIDIDVASSTNPADGGNDVIVIGTGSVLVVGGAGSDTILGGDASNVILGDNGRVTSAVADTPRYGTLPITLGLVETTDPGIGGDDTIVTGSLYDVILGGPGADRITT